jgi:hypothetical protein
VERPRDAFALTLLLSLFLATAADADRFAAKPAVS